MKRFLVLSSLVLAVSGFGQSWPSTNMVFVAGGSVTVDNSNAIPVIVTEPSQPDVYPAFGAGFGFGLSIFGFGWILRMAKNVTRPDNG